MTIVATQPNNIPPSNQPVLLRRLALQSQKPSLNSRPTNILRLLRPPIFKQTRVNLSRHRGHLPQDRLRGPTLFARPSNQPGSNDHRVLKPHRLNTLFNLPLHLHVAEHGLRVRALSADQHAHFAPGVAGRARQRQVQIVLDLVLCFESADRCAGGGEGREEDFGRGLDGFDVGCPFRCVRVDGGVDLVLLRGDRWVCASGQQVHGRGWGGGAEGVEDVRSLD